ncbi:dihydroorotase family protein [Candidatus Bathyarchaeota archaeon]|nr:dihydroorotase family protein [Candidatus Bathyarchaeota archaeon]
MTVDLVLKNAKILLGQKIERAGIAVDSGYIVKIAKDVNLPAASDKIDVKEFLVLPGLIDVHIHLRDQELSYKEDFVSGTSAAANGGVTTVLDMPNNKPVTMDASSLRERMAAASEKLIVNAGFLSAFPSNVKEIPDIVKEGAKGFKLYMSEKIGGIDPSDDELITKALVETQKLNIPVCIHAEDKQLLEIIYEEKKKNKDATIDAFLHVHSQDAEVKAIERILNLAQKSKAKIHICHVSTSKGVELIEMAKKTELKVTCEVTPHHLLLTYENLKELGIIGLTKPPLRLKDDVRSLWTGLQKGVVDTIASDHAPHSLDEKKKTSFWQIPSGIAGLETMLPLMLTQVNKGLLSLPKLVETTSKRPRDVFGIRERGEIREGHIADLVAVDLKKEWTIDSSKFYSKAKFSPFDGWKVKGKPVKTFINGHLVMDNGEVFTDVKRGRIIR